MLTKRLVDAATPRQTEYQLFDGEIPGLALRVHPNSSKVYALFYRTSTGRKRTLTLGRPGAITAEQARPRSRTGLLPLLRNLGLHGQGRAVMLMLRDALVSRALDGVAWQRVIEG